MKSRAIKFLGMRGNTWLRCSALAACMLAGSAVLAQGNYPSKPIRLIVPFGAGGSPDTFARMVAKSLEPRIGQPVIVENKPGVNSILGSGFVANAQPDGYTILYGTNSGTAAARSLVKKLSYDPINGLAGIILVQNGYFALLVRPEDKNLSVPQLLERMRLNPEKYSVGGSSSTAEVSYKMMQNAARLDTTYIRYKESGTMRTDLIGGRLGAALDPINASLTIHNSGKLHILAVFSPDRLPVLPNTPTVAETLPGVTLSTWTGFFAPAKTPRPIINYLHAKLLETVKEEAILKWNQNAGTALFMTPAEVDAHVRKEEPRWQELFRSAGIAPQ